MRIYQNASLQRFNTFGLDESAKEVWVMQDEDDVVEFATDKDALANLKLILGGGSNLLLTGPIDGLVAHVALRGKRVVEEHDDHVIVEGMAGENWHQFVLWTLENGWGGLENLSLIPGQVGTAPVQNIGAYGVELKDHFVDLDGFMLGTGEKRSFNLEECRFAYRDSVFKHEMKGKFLITAVRFKLTVKDHAIRTEYGAIQSELDKMGLVKPTIQQVSDAVIAIRQSKLPDPKEIGNSGSFFKNPIVPVSELERLKTDYPDIVAYPINDEEVKLAAGWLIDTAGWKGYRRGDAGVHEKQALVLVNYGDARGEEVYQLAKDIITDIQKRFGITLQPEVNVL